MLFITKDDWIIALADRTGGVFGYPRHKDENTAGGCELRFLAR